MENRPRRNPSFGSGMDDPPRRSDDSLRRIAPPTLSLLALRMPLLLLPLLSLAVAPLPLSTVARRLWPPPPPSPLSPPPPAIPSPITIVPLPAKATSALVIPLAMTLLLAVPAVPLPTLREKAVFIPAAGPRLPRNVLAVFIVAHSLRRPLCSVTSVAAVALVAADAKPEQLTPSPVLGSARGEGGVASSAA